VSTTSPEELSGWPATAGGGGESPRHGPALILADEPTGNLDSTSARDVLALLEELHSAGRTVVLITMTRGGGECRTGDPDLDGLVDDPIAQHNEALR